MRPAWLNPNDYWFNDVLKRNFERIRDECLNALDRGLFVPHTQSQEHLDPGEKLAERWDCFAFKDRTVWLEQNRVHAPFTYALMSSIPEVCAQPKGSIYFSVIHPRTGVAGHESCHPIGARTRHQLCLEAPAASVEDLYLDLNGERRTWTVGEIISFDDAYWHYVVNNTDHRRISLLFDTI